MNEQQSYTPKYWVGHDIKSDDIFISTLAKCANKSTQLMHELFGEDCFSNNDLSVSLIEIRLVK
jgi:hypothetical protein